MSRLKLAARRLSSVLIYVLIITVAVSIARSRTQKASGAEDASGFYVTTEITAATKPFFSLSTTRTFGTNENPRLWLDHRLLESIDFRVYRINDCLLYTSDAADE